MSAIAGIDGYCPPSGQKIHLYPTRDGRFVEGRTLCGLDMEWTIRGGIGAAFWHEPDVSNPAVCRRCKRARA